MPKRDKLFQLVRSLSKSEKRYFSIYTQMHIKGEDNDYMKLFKEFERQEVLDEQKIKENLRDENLIQHYAVTKSYLYDLLLKAMRSYSKHSADKRVLDIIQDVEFLYTKGIFDQALQLLRKARELSKESGLVAVSDLILHWEKLVMLASGNRFLDQDGFKMMVEEQEVVSALRIDQHNLWLYSSRLSLLRNGKFLTHPEELEDIKAYVENTESPDYTPNYFRNYYLDRLVRCQWYLIKNSFPEAFQESVLLTNLMEGPLGFWKRQPYLYFRVLALQIQCLVYSQKFETARKRLKDLNDKLPISTFSLYAEAWWCFIVNYVDLKECVQMGMRESSKHRMNQLKHDLERFPGFLPEVELNLEFLLVLVLYLAENFEEAEASSIKICRQSEGLLDSATIESAWILRIALQIQTENDRKLTTVCHRYHGFLQNEGLAENPLSQILSSCPTSGEPWSNEQKSLLIQHILDLRSHAEPKNGTHRCRILALEQLKELKIRLN